MKSRVVLATVGTLGDLHPFIAVGLALREHGVEVVLACAAEYREKVETAGLEFRPVRPSFDDLERSLGMDRAQLTRAVVERTDFLFRKLVVPGVRDAYADMLAIVAGADMVLTSSLSIGARLAAERTAIPWMAIVLQPLMFLSAFDPPVVPQLQWLTPLLRRLGPVPTAHVLRFMKHLVDGFMGPVHALRREIGLAPTPLNPIFDGQFSALGAIGLYSAVLGEQRADYPPRTSIVGFASYDSQDGASAALAPALRAFLDAGAAPLVFTLGSLVVNSPGSFYRESLAAARLLGRRAVLLVGEAALSEYMGCGAADVYVAAYEPHSLLFPHAAAIVHQGGIGTLAQALRSGRPHLIVPFFADQQDNAARAVKLGVARSIAPGRYDAVSAARELGALTALSGHALRAAGVRDRMRGENGASQAARIVVDRLESRCPAFSESV